MVTARRGPSRGRLAASDLATFAADAVRAARGRAPAAPAPRGMGRVSGLFVRGGNADPVSLEPIPRGRAVRVGKQWMDYRSVRQLLNRDPAATNPLTRQPFPESVRAKHAAGRLRGLTAAMRDAREFFSLTRDDDMMYFTDFVRRKGFRYGKAGAGVAMRKEYAGGIMYECRLHNASQSVHHFLRPTRSDKRHDYANVGAGTVRVPVKATPEFKDLARKAHAASRFPAPMTFFAGPPLPRDP